MRVEKYQSQDAMSLQSDSTDRAEWENAAIW